MQTVTILRQLWRRRVATAAIAAVSILVGFFVVYQYSFPAQLQSRKYEVGIANVRILVDTPESQVVDVAPRGSDTLGIRANLLANLMVDGDVKAAIGRRAGMKPAQFTGIAESGTDTAAATPPGDPRTAEVFRTKVSTTADGNRLPIIEVEAQAPGTAAATRLANATIAGLGDYLNSKAAQDKVSDARRLRVGGLGVADAHMAPRGPHTFYGLAAALLLFALGCFALVGGSRLVGAYRAVAREEDAVAARRDDEHGDVRPLAAVDDPARGERAS